MRSGGDRPCFWAASTTDPRALQNPGGGRAAATWYASPSFNVTVNMNDGLAHRLALYLLDWDNGARQERVDALNRYRGPGLGNEHLGQ